jgi:cytochrome c biogenesis protein
MRLAAVRPESMDDHQTFKMAVNDTVKLADGTQVRLTKFVPDAYAMDGDLYQRSRDLETAAAKLELTKDGKTQTAFLFRSPEAGMGEVALVGPYDLQQNPMSGMAYRFVAILDMAPFTGLQVSHQPGEGLIWAGCVLMATGLILAFCVLHQRYWAVATKDKEGRLVLWMGAAANKKRESFEERFQQLADEIARELEAPSELARSTSSGLRQS